MVIVHARIAIVLGKSRCCAHPLALGASSSTAFASATAGLPSARVAVITVFAISLLLAILEKNLGGVLAKPVGDAGRILQVRLRRGVIVAWVRSGGESRNMYVVVQRVVDCVDVIIHVIGSEKIRRE